MKTAKIRKQFHYKQATLTSTKNDTLQNLLGGAIKKLNVHDRHETILEHAVTDESGGVQQWLRFINSPRAAAGFQFGVLVLYSPSLHHMVVATTGEKSDELDVSKLSPPEGKQFMETPLYFAVRDNHVVILQSMVQRADALEKHLNWLLTQAEMLGGNDRVTLTDTIPLEIQKKLKKNSVKRIMLRAPFFDTPSVPTGPKKISQSIKAAAGVGFDMLKGLLSDTQYKSLLAQDMTDVQDIQLNLEIKVVGSKKTATSDNDVMRTLMNTISHVENADVVHAEIEGIGTMKGSEMRIHDFRSVNAIDGVLETADVYDAMRQWLDTLVDKGKISGDH